MVKSRNGAHLTLVKDSNRKNLLPFRRPGFTDTRCRDVLGEMLSDVEKLSSMIEMALHMAEYLDPDLLESKDFLRVFEPVDATISIVYANLQLIEEMGLSAREEELAKQVRSAVERLEALAEHMLSPSPGRG